MKAKTITRAEFIRRFMNDCDVPYVKANQLFDCMTAVMADAVTSGHRIAFGRVGALIPVKLPPKTVNMSFVPEKGRKLKRVNRTYYVGSRIKYKFAIHQKFLETHNLKWFQ